MNRNSDSVRIVDGDGFKTISKADFDPSKHTAAPAPTDPPANETDAQRATRLGK